MPKTIIAKVIFFVCTKKEKEKETSQFTYHLFENFTYHMFERRKNIIDKKNRYRSMK